jgi:hypothetical protein
LCAQGGVQTRADQDRSPDVAKTFGFQLDAGAPDGAGLMLLFRPFSWLRANGGYAYNYLGSGIRGGITWTPVHWAVTPTLNFDLGHYFSGDLTKFVTPSSTAERDLLSSAAYTFWSGQIGLEFGSQNGFVFYLRGGISYLSAAASGQSVARLLLAGITADHAGEGHFSALLPSFSLGLLVFVL